MRPAYIFILLLLPAVSGYAQLLPDINDSATPDSSYISPDSAVTRVADSAATQSSAKLVVVKRDFNYREQIGIALAMMAFVALMMTTTQTFNPR
jgi:hypothetical protein